MISLINNAPENIAAFKATGEVTRADYDNVVTLVKKQDSINFILVLDTSLSNFTIAALIKDLGVGLKHFTK